MTRKGPPRLDLPAVFLLAAGAILALLSYRPALRAGFVFDDQPNIVTATALHWTEASWASVRALMGSAFLTARPVSNGTFALNHLVGGLDPYGYHLLNVVIHLLVGVALAWVIVVYLKEGDRNGSRVGGLRAAAVAVALFWVHPLNTQAVTYVVQRMTSLVTLFCLLSFAMYLVGRSRDGRWAPVPWLVGALLAWGLALGSKENAFALPVVFLIWEACFRRQDWREGWASLGPRRRTAVALSAGVAALTVMLLARKMGAGSLSLSGTWPTRDYNGWERVLTQGRVQLLYLSLLLWPTPSRLTLDHDFTVSRGFLEPPATLLASAFWLVAVLAAIMLARRRPRYGFPLLAYIALHVIESGPLNLELVFEHRMYLPMSMLAVLVAVVIHDQRGRSRSAVEMATLGLVLVFASLTHARNTVWADPIAFFRDTAAKAPDKFRPQLVLGSELAMAGRFEEARPILLRAIELDPTQSAPHNQLGNAYLMNGQLEQALTEYQLAAELEPNNPGALYNLGMLLHEQGRSQDAAVYLRRFVAIAPDYLQDAVALARERLDSSKDMSIP